MVSSQPLKPSKHSASGKIGSDHLQAPVDAQRGSRQADGVVEVLILGVADLADAEGGAGVLVVEDVQAQVNVQGQVVGEPEGVVAEDIEEGVPFRRNSPVNKPRPG